MIRGDWPRSATTTEFSRYLKVETRPVPLAAGGISHGSLAPGGRCGGRSRSLYGGHTWGGFVTR